MSRYDENSEYSRRKPRDSNRDYDDIDYTDEDNYENNYEELGNNVNWDDDDDYEDFQYDFEKDLDDDDDSFVYSDSIKNSSKKSKNKYIEDDDEFDFDLNDENDFFNENESFYSDDEDDYLDTDSEFTGRKNRINSDDDDYDDYNLDDEDFNFTLTEDDEDDEDDFLAPKRPLRDRTGRSNLIEDDDLFVDEKKKTGTENKFKNILNNPKLQAGLEKVKSLPVMDKLKTLDKKFLLVIGFALFIVFFMLFNKDDSNEIAEKSEPNSEEVVKNNSGNDFETIQSTGDSKDTEEPTKVKVTEKEHKVELVSNSSEEVVQEKAKDLSKKTHYDDNVESSSFDRTSLYDKPIGRVYAPYVRLDSIVYSGASELNMRRGVGTVEYGEQLNEKTVAIAGHRSRNAGEFFTSIIYLNIGDHVYVDMWDEEENVVGTRTYQVENITKVDPSNTDVLLDELQDDRRKLVLITCSDYNAETGLYDKRWIVEAYEVF